MVAKEWFHFFFFFFSSSPSFFFFRFVDLQHTNNYFKHFIAKLEFVLSPSPSCTVFAHTCLHDNCARNKITEVRSLDKTINSNRFEANAKNRQIKIVFKLHKQCNKRRHSQNSIYILQVTKNIRVPYPYCFTHKMTFIIFMTIFHFFFALSLFFFFLL